MSKKQILRHPTLCGGPSQPSDEELSARTRTNVLRSDDRVSIGRTSETPNQTSDQFAAAGQAEFLDDLADVLRVVAVRDEQGIVGVDNDKVFNADQGNKLFGAIDIV